MHGREAFVYKLTPGGAVANLPRSKLTPENQNSALQQHGNACTLVTSYPNVRTAG